MNLYPKISTGAVYSPNLHYGVASMLSSDFRQGLWRLVTFVGKSL